MNPAAGAPEFGALQLTVTLRLLADAVGCSTASRLLACAPAEPWAAPSQLAAATAANTDESATTSAISADSGRAELMGPPPGSTHG